MSAILGSENILYIRRSVGSFERVGFLTVNSFEADTSFLNTTVRGNAGFKTEIPIENGYNVGFSAIVFEDADLTGKIGYKELREIQDAFERVEFKLEVFGKNFTRYGFAYISNIGEESPVDSAISFDGSLNVYGRILELADTEPPSTPYLSMSIDALDPSFDLSWTAATDNLGVDYYQIRKIQSGLPEQLINVGKTLSYTDSSITYFTYYSYNVRAVDISGNVGAWSNKRLGYAPVPMGNPTPDYKQYQDGSTKLYQDGTPKEYQ